METKTDNVEVEFNISKALVVIEKDGDLNAMFSAKFGDNYKMAHALINSGSGINPKAEQYAKDLFNKVIVIREELLEQYNSLVVGAKEGPKVNAKKRWGLKAISEDIAKHGDKVKQIHRTARGVQLLKKLYTKYERLTYNERFTKKTLSDAELREMNGAIETFQKKMDSILKPKK